MTPPRDTVTAPRRTLDDIGGVSTLAGLSDKEHTVFCAAMWAKANNRLVNFAAIGRHMSPPCTGQWCGKLFARARLKLSLNLGHDVELPPYDGFERYDDLVSIPVGGMEWFVSYFDGEEPLEDGDAGDYDDHGLDEDTREAPHWLTVLVSDGDEGEIEEESFDDPH